MAKDTPGGEFSLIVAVYDWLENLGELSLTSRTVMVNVVVAVVFPSCGGCVSTSVAWNARYNQHVNQLLLTFLFNSFVPSVCLFSPHSLQYKYALSVKH